MDLKHIIKPPKKRRIRKILKERQPKHRENPKGVVFMYGNKVTLQMKLLMKNFYMFKKSSSVHLSKNNPVHPFEDHSMFERFSKKFDKSFLIFGSHSKKRPNNLVMARFFNHTLLDMIEFGIEDLKTMGDFHTEKIPANIKPCLVFCGTEFEHSAEWQKVKNMLIDFFRGIEAPHLSVVGIRHAIFVTLDEGRLYFRSFRIDLVKSGVKIPKVELTEIGPSFTLVLRRVRMASENHLKLANKVPVEQKRSKKRKNVEINPLGTKLGRVHMAPQDLRAIQTRKRKALKLTKEEFLEAKRRKLTEREEMQEV